MKKFSLLIVFLLFAFISQAQTVYKTKTGTKFHVQSCGYLKSSFETTVAQAKADGLTACSVCKPSASTTPQTSAINQISESSSTPSSNSSSSGSVRCSGITKAGAQCKRMTTSSNGRCYQH